MPVSTGESIFAIARATSGGSEQAHPVRRRRTQLRPEAVARGRRPLGVDVPRRVRGGPAEPGCADPLRNPQRARGFARRTDLLGLARHGVGDARARDSAVHGRRPPSSTRLRRLRRLVLHRAGLHQHAERARPCRVSHCTPRTAPTRTRSCSPGATRRSTPSRSPTSSTLSCSATARRSCSRSARSSASGRARARRVVATSCCWRLAASGGVYVPRFYDVSYDDARCPGGRDAQPARRTRPGPQAHPDGPRRVALPAQPAGAAGRDRARAVQRRDLPGLHPWLPVLPGRA